MCTEGICSRVPINNIDQHLINTPINISINTPSTLRWQSVDSQIISQTRHWVSMHMSWSTLRWLLTNCWASIDQMSIKMLILSGSRCQLISFNLMSTKYRLRCQLSVAWVVNRVFSESLPIDTQLQMPLVYTWSLHSGAVLWNSLPSAVRQTTSLTYFRQLLINSNTAFM